MSTAFLYTSHEQVELKLKTNASYISTYKVKDLGINPTKYIEENIYKKNYEMLVKEIKEKLNK